MSRLLIIAAILLAGCTSGEGDTGYTVRVLTTGGGQLTSSVSGFGSRIVCGANCQAQFVAHEAVTLTATPDPDATFLGWSGACSGTGPCTFEASPDVLVWAAFGPPSTAWTAVVPNRSNGLAAASYGDDFVLAGNRGPDSGTGGQLGTIVALTQNGTEDWHIDTSELARFNDLAPDPATGTLDAVGVFAGQLVVSGHRVSSEAGDAGFLLESTGSNVTALVGVGGAGPSELKYVYSTGDGVTVSGTYKGEVELGGSTQTAVGERDVVVADRAGGTWSSVSFGSIADDNVVGMAKDALDRCWLLLELGDSTMIGQDLAGPGLVLVVLDGDSVASVVTLGGEPNDSTEFLPGAILAVDADSMLVAGSYRGSVAIGTHRFSSGGSSDFFLTRLQLDSTPLWAVSHGGAESDYAQALAVVSTVVVVGGAFSGPAGFGGATPIDSNSHSLETEEADDGFLAAYSLEDGAFHWVRRIGGGSSDPGVFDLAVSGDSVLAAATVDIGPFATGADPVQSGEGSSALGILIGL